MLGDQKLVLRYKSCLYSTIHSYVCVFYAPLTGRQLVLPDCKQLPDDAEASDCIHIGLQPARKVHFETRMTLFRL